MDRRKSLKSIVLGSVAGGLALHGCKPSTEGTELVEAPKITYPGRVPKETELINELQDEQFLNPHEMETLTILCDLILPPSDEFKGASDADVVSFIEFMSKDEETLQPDLRGGKLHHRLTQPCVKGTRRTAPWRAEGAREGAPSRTENCKATSL